MYEVLTPPRPAKPIYTWAENLEEGALEQANNLALLPFAVNHVALMPDAHQGYGMPIGGVLFADRAVVPFAIGVDIGCGVVLARTGLHRDDLDPATLGMVLNQIAAWVPVGEGRERHVEDKTEAAASLIDALGGKPASVMDEWVLKATPQCGTLGAGNHFIELQADEEGHVFLMIHSGSRNLGYNICMYFHKVAYNLNDLWHSDLPHKELAYLPLGTDEHTAYWEAMNFALAFAERNRQTMLARVYDALNMHAGPLTNWETIVDVHHNYAAWEHHYGHDGIVHRKGAVRARRGDLVLIPGSMGTASYVAEGLGSKESFETCQHGAGRAMSRGKTRKEWTPDDVTERMRQAGVALVSGNPAKSMEEHPEAYKDIESVMHASEDLIKPIKRLTPLGVVKG